jgi:undecaprenyl-diphosphatase
MPMELKFTPAISKIVGRTVLKTENEMSLGIVLVLAVIQGLAELLPVSSSAHVILAEHLMGFDPSAPDMTFLLVMLHTGTMFAVLIYFWKRWKKIFQDKSALKKYVIQIVIATVATGILGFGLKLIIEKAVLEKFLGYENGEIEQIFNMLPLIAVSLFVVGLLILYAGLREKKSSKTAVNPELSNRDSLWIGLSQGLVLPFRGLSRSGTTISVGLLLGKGRELCEEFSFALAVVLTPPVIWRELKRFLQTRPPDLHMSSMLFPGLMGAVFSFLAGLVALRWLSKWLESGKWHYFGIYCLAFSVLVGVVAYLK